MPPPPRRAAREYSKPLQGAARPCAARAACRQADSIVVSRPPWSPSGIHGRHPRTSHSLSLAPNLPHHGTQSKAGMVTSPGVVGRLAGPRCALARRVSEDFMRLTDQERADLEALSSGQLSDAMET